MISMLKKILFSSLLCVAFFQSTAQIGPEPAENKTTEKTPKKEQPAGKTAVPQKTVKRFGPGVTAVKPEQEIDSLGISPYKVILAFVLVGGGLAGFFYLLRKFGAGSVINEKRASMRIKGRIQLDPKNSVVLLGVYEDEFLLGVGSGGVNVISKFKQLEDSEDGLEDEAYSPDGAKKKKVSFREAIMNITGQNINSEDINRNP